MYIHTYSLKQSNIFPRAFRRPPPPFTRAPRPRAERARALPRPSWFAAETNKTSKIIIT